MYIVAGFLLLTSVFRASSGDGASKPGGIGRGLGRSMSFSDTRGSNIMADVEADLASSKPPAAMRLLSVHKKQDTNGGSFKDPAAEAKPTGGSASSFTFAKPPDHPPEGATRQYPRTPSFTPGRYPAHKVQVDPSQLQMLNQVSTTAAGTKSKKDPLSPSPEGSGGGGGSNPYPDVSVGGLKKSSAVSGGGSPQGSTAGGVSAASGGGSGTSGGGSGASGGGLGASGGSIASGVGSQQGQVSPGVGPIQGSGGTVGGPNVGAQGAVGDGKQGLGGTAGSPDQGLEGKAGGPDLQGSRTSDTDQDSTSTNGDSDETRTEVDSEQDGAGSKRSQDDNDTKSPGVEIFTKIDGENHYDTGKYYSVVYDQDGTKKTDVIKIEGKPGTTTEGLHAIFNPQSVDKRPLYYTDDMVLYGSPSEKVCIYGQKDLPDKLIVKDNDKWKINTYSTDNKVESKEFDGDGLNRFVEILTNLQNAFDGPSSQRDKSLEKLAQHDLKEIVNSFLSPTGANDGNAPGEGGSGEGGSGDGGSRDGGSGDGGSGDGGSGDGGSGDGVSGEGGSGEGGSGNGGSENGSSGNGGSENGSSGNGGSENGGSGNGASGGASGNGASGGASGNGASGGASGNGASGGASGNGASGKPEGGSNGSPDCCSTIASVLKSLIDACTSSCSKS